jgi:hypothetical protein
VTQPVGGASEKSTAVADHNEIVLVAKRHTHDRVGFRASGELNIEVDALLGSLLAREARNSLEELVLLELVLLDFAHRSRIPRQTSLECERMKLSVQAGSQIECELERLLAFRMPIECDEYSLDAAHSWKQAHPWSVTASVTRDQDRKVRMFDEPVGEAVKYETTGPATTSMVPCDNKIEAMVVRIANDVLGRLVALEDDLLERHSGTIRAIACAAKALLEEPTRGLDRLPPVLLRLRMCGRVGH